MIKKLIMAFMVSALLADCYSQTYLFDASGVSTEAGCSGRESQFDDTIGADWICLTTGALKIFPVRSPLSITMPSAR